MKKTEKIVGDKIYLRLLGLDDVTARYCSWLNDSEVNKFLETKSSNLAQLTQYVKEKINRSDVLFYGIFDKENDTHLGNVKLEPVDWAGKKAVFGIMIGDRNYWGRGIGTEATRLISDYALGELGLDEVELGVIADNTKACRAYEKAGFKQVRVNPKAVNYDGVSYDEIIMLKHRSQV